MVHVLAFVQGERQPEEAAGDDRAEPEHNQHDHHQNRERSNDVLRSGGHVILTVTALHICRNIIGEYNVRGCSWGLFRLRRS